MTPEPPLLLGAVQPKTTWLLPPVALVSEGGPGLVAGVADFSLLAAPVPTPLTASTS